MQEPSSAEIVVDPRRYFEASAVRNAAVRKPVCLYLETTNRCNLLCTTCPRTYEELEPPADMSWELFTRIVDQVPDISRVVLHGVGEPMLVKELPRMIRYLKDRGAYVLFNTNGTVLNEKNGRALIEAGLDELRVSLDAATREIVPRVRGKDYFERILQQRARLPRPAGARGAPTPRVSVWLTGLKETVARAARLRAASPPRCGVKEVYLQRLVFFDEDAVGLARPDQALFERLAADETRLHRRGAGTRALARDHVSGVRCGRSPA